MTDETPTADTMELGGKQYHIGLKKGDLAPYILICGDPARSKRTSELFDEVSFSAHNREFLTFTGTYKGIPVSVMSIGMGPDNTEIAMVEISRITQRPTVIRVGSSGGLQEEIRNGDLVITTGAYRLENTSTYYVRDGFPAVADYRVTAALCASARDLGVRFHLGLTATAPSFYAAQARKMSDFPTTDDDLSAEMARNGVLNFEMESSTLFTLAHLAGIKAGTVCAVYATRHDNRPVTLEEKAKAEMDCIMTGLGALPYLEMIKKEQKEGAAGDIWVPAI